MKTFTRLFTLLVFATISNFSIAQTYDIAVALMEISSAQGATNAVPPGFSSTVRYSLTNTGTSVIPAGTQYARGVFRNVNTAMIGPDTFALANPINPGDTVNFVINSSQYTFDGSITIQNVCLVAALVGVTETDTLNNSFCASFQVNSSTTHDVAANSISIVTPNNLDGFDIDGGSNTVPDLEEMSLSIENTGDIYYVSGQRFPCVIWLGGSEIPTVATFGSDPGQVLNLTVPANLCPEVPQDSGTYEVCFAFNPGDDDSSNDTTCTSFTIVDNFDIYNPDNWPLEVEEIKEVEEIIVTASKNMIGFKNVSSNTKVKVTDIQGKLITTQFVNSDSMIEFNEAAGVYIVYTLDAYGNSKTTKISVQ